MITAGIRSTVFIGLFIFYYLILIFVNRFGLYAVDRGCNFAHIKFFLSILHATLRQNMSVSSIVLATSLWEQRRATIKRVGKRVMQKPQL